MTSILSRKRVETKDEKNLLTGCIVSTRFCRETLSLIKKEYLQSDYSKIVLRWIINYYDKYGKSPENDIQNIFLTESENLEEGTKETIREFLNEISKRYVNQESFNVDYILDQSIEYIKKRALIDHYEKIKAFVDLGNIEEAEREVATYTQISKLTSPWVNPFEGEYIDNALIKDEEYLLELPGMLGEILGPLKRSWLVSLMGPMKRGKTWWLLEFLFSGITSRLKCAVISLEMHDDQVAIRSYKRLTGLPTETEIVVFPIFDCLHNQEGTCNLRHRPQQNSIIDENGIKTRYTLESKHLVCTHCRKEVGDFIPSVWYDYEKRKKFSIGGLKRMIKSFSTMYGKDNWRLIHHPIKTANIGDIKRDLDLLEYQENFIPDVVIIDYADILKPEDSRLVGREGINETWMSLKNLAQTRNCLVVTATQSNRSSFDKKNVSVTDTSEDIRKIAHVDLMGVLNQTREEKRAGIMRFGIVAHRHKYFEDLMQVQVLQELKNTGQPFLDSEINRVKRTEEEEE